MYSRRGLPSRPSADKETLRGVHGGDPVPRRRTARKSRRGSRRARTRTHGRSYFGQVRRRRGRRPRARLINRRDPARR